MNPIESEIISSERLELFRANLFSENLPSQYVFDGDLKNLKSDVRDLETSIFKGVDVVIHLANIANDTAVELNPNLSWEVNVLASQQLAE